MFIKKSILLFLVFLIIPLSNSHAYDGAYTGAQVDGAISYAQNLVTLSGVAGDSTNLGAFTGTTIPDNQTIKQSLQALETSLETKLAANGDGSSLTGLLWSQIGSTPTTLSGYGITDAESSTSNNVDPDRLAGDTVDDNFIDDAIIVSTIARDSELPTAATLSVDDLITLSGVAEGSTHLGAFTGTTITDNQTIKAALQELETFVEGLGGGHAAVTLAASATTGGLSLSTQEIGFQAATTSTNGYLTSTDWNTFNGKQNALTNPLVAAGTQALTDNWDVGSYTITALRFVSDQATGTSPFSVTSTTVVTNLNADTVDGGDWASPGAIGTGTPAAATFTTLSAGGGGATIDADGDVVGKSFTVTKVSGVAGLQAVYEADTTSTLYRGVMGPADVSASWSLQWSSSDPAGSFMMLAAPAGTGDPNGNAISAMSWITPGTNVTTFITTPSSANLAAAVTGETGSGALVFAESPTLVTPVLGTIASGVGTALTALDDDNVDFDDVNGDWTATAVGPALEEMVNSINGGVPNSATAKVHWSQLTGVPAGFADGTDDTGSGSLGSNLSSTTNDITTDNAVIQLIGNSEDIDIEFGTDSIDITTDTGVTEIDFIGITLKDDGAALLVSGGDAGTPSAINLSNASNYPAATSSTSGISELAIASELNTGTDATRAVTPDALAGSTYGTVFILLRAYEYGTTLATGDGKDYFVVPPELNGWDLVSVFASVGTASSSGTPTFNVYNVTDSQDMLSTALTIDANEKNSSTAATPAVINTTYDDVATGDEIRLDCDVVGTGTTGGDILLGFRLP